jgi:signal transduction histidine kinase
VARRRTGPLAGFPATAIASASPGKSTDGGVTDQLRVFFQVNRSIVYFVYGLVFFTLGLSIALQSHRHSRLTLARRLRWLVAFGLLHGLNEWVDLFLPLQAPYLTEPAMHGLIVMQRALLAVSFACLMLFGVDLLRPLPPTWQWLRWLPAATLVAWAALAAPWVSSGFVPFETAAADAELLARYLIGFPAALLAGYAMLARAPELLAPLGGTDLRALRAAGFALLAYAVAAGLLTPPSSLGPARMLNAETLRAAIGVPAPVVRALLGLVLLGAIVRTLEVFDAETDRRMRANEEAQLLGAERDRIARDLHDRTLQSVYAAGLMVSACLDRQRASAAAGDETLRQTLDALDRAVEELRRHIAALQSPPSHVSLAEGLRDLVRQSPLRSMAEVKLGIDLPDDVRYRPRPVAHVLSVASEALSNVARHASARSVRIDIVGSAERLMLTIEDDGRGFPTDYVAGYGIRDMQERARLLSGRLSIDTEPDHGTRLQLEVPFSELQP